MEFSDTASPAARRASVTAADISHLPEVDVTVANDAAKVTQNETSMTLLQGLKTYPKAVGWSVLLSACIIMEGFDIALISSLYAVPAFQQRYGDRQDDGSYEISAAWQSGLSNGALIGEILGLFLTGIIAERIGYIKTMIGALVLLSGFIFLLFFAQSLPMLLIGEILCGLPWGTFQTLTTTYASEVCPVALRPYLTTYVNLCWVIGQFISSAVLKGVSGEGGSIGYKLPYGLQWIWPFFLIFGIALAPESPWWLVRRGRIEDAKNELIRLTSRTQSDFDPVATVNMMIYTNELEKKDIAGAKYWDCFKGINLRRTEVVTFVWAIQTLCGGMSMIGFSAYFFTQAGLDTSHAFSMSLGLYALGLVGTICSWFLMSRFGRRTLYLWGQILMGLVLFLIAFISLSDSGGAQWAIAAMMLVYTFVYDATVGPVCYSLVAELASTRVRNKTVVLARNLYNITGIVANVLTPHMLNPDSWDWGAKAGFFWGGSCALCALWTYYRLPEPKRRTYAELDALFQAKIPAREFASTDVAALNGTFGNTAIADQQTEKDICEMVERLDKS
ncbi:sugar porter family MFS transporter [Hortaea werneckii]|nr:sugar porter family MFS transporter [Hortaea werneckii]KAI7088352.1 sugar porter family MFS transporter [Hortaea werneckii]KAI7224459.1 sugar porter family MFS transporter [Hortaea werneckii]KAI7309108.1 sugar porter family MFS transporter [Hortaea werneckii]KAI7388393.1 sugar porter family MFS transporter [Hortaea werneckii]